MKKFVALMMTLALVLALAVPVMAATNITGSPGSAGSAGGYAASYAGSTNVPNLDVEVSYSKVSSNNAYLVLNPYKLTIAENKAGAGEKDQVIASPVKIENKTVGCAVDVIVKGAHATYTNVEASSKPIDDTKQVDKPTAYLVVYGGDSETTPVPTSFIKAEQVLISKDATNTTAAIVSTVESSKTGYVLIGGSLATNLKLDATNFWSSDTKVEGIGYTLMIRAAAPSSST